MRTLEVRRYLKAFPCGGLNRIRAFAARLKPCPSTKRERVPGTTRNLNVQQPPEIEARIEDSTARGCPPLSVAVRGTRTRVSAPHGGE
jgi:hypothetical protein